jgi:hypothetical protein
MIVEEQSLSAFLRAPGKPAAVSGGGALTTGCKGGRGRRCRGKARRRGGAGATDMANSREADNSAALRTLKAILRLAAPSDMKKLCEQVWRSSLCDQRAPRRAIDVYASLRDIYINDRCIAHASGDISLQS